MKIAQRHTIFSLCLIGLLHVTMVAALVVTPVVQSAPLPYAATLAPRPLATAIATLVDQADLIVRAQVVQSKSQWNSSHTLIETEHTLAVRYMITGQERPTLLIRTDGGFLPEEGLGVRTSHTASFAPGEEVLLFLQESANGYRVVGGETGKFTVLNAEAVSAFYHDHLALSQMTTIILTEVEKQGRSATLPADWSAHEPTTSPHRLDANQPVVDPKWPGAVPQINVKVNLNSVHIDDQGGSAEQFLETITNALRTWSIIPEAGFTFLYDGDTASTTTEFNNKSEILFIANGTNSQLGQAQIWFTSSGAIVEADIWINDDYQLDATGNPAENEIDLESAILHELGHWLPLGHMSNANAVMYAVLGAGTRKVSLSADDIAGIVALYPCPAISCIDPAYVGSATMTPTVTTTATVATPTPIPTATATVVTPVPTVFPTPPPQHVTVTPTTGIFLPIVTR
ncbi:MAG: matrixin family metalloprotease [Caldilineaceae bacterium]